LPQDKQNELNFPPPLALAKLGGLPKVVEIDLFLSVKTDITLDYNFALRQHFNLNAVR
jgi:hypothetical protein